MAVGQLQLNASEERFRQLANAVPQIVCVCDAEGNVEYLNDRWYDYVGVTAGDSFALETTSYLHPDDLERIQPLWEQAKSTRRIFEAELRIRNKFGRYRWFLTRSVPQLENGVCTAWFGTSTDVHDQKMASQAIAEKEEQFRTLADSIPQMVWMSDPDGRAIWCNERWYNYTGKSPAELLGLEWESVVDPQVFPEIFAAWKSGVEKALPVEFTVPLRAADGSYRRFLTRALPLKDEAGQVLRWFGTSTDVQEQTQAREELHSFFMQAPAPMVILTGPEHLITLANPLYEKYVNREVQGKTVRQAFTEQEAGDFLILLDHVYQTGEPYVGRDLPLILFDENGKPQSARIDVSYSAYRGNDGKIKGVLVFFHDVTAEYNARVNMRRYNDDLRLAKEESERANQLKSAFLANMSHEIRTPLGAMIGFAELLREPGLSEARRTNYLDILARNGEGLSVILNDILDLSKVEAGQLTLEYTAASPPEIAADIVSLMRVKAEAKNLVLSYDCEPSTPVLIFTDPTRLRQILLNIVGNAVKFTQAGAIKVRSFGVRSANDLPAVNFEISDTGIGIPAGQELRVFEMFVQADGSTTRRFGGTGLGLALSRNLARALGGDIVITETAQGKGSKFLVTIEDGARRVKSSGLAEKAPEHSAAQSARPLRDVRVLVVDDSPDNQDLIRHNLNRHGASVDCAGNGAIGLRMALDGRYDVVLMDIQMPGMDGFTATHELRRVGYDRPIIALTAHAMNDVRDKILKMGADTHLPKPINFSDLVRTIHAQLPQ